ncbi:endonuclease [Flavobacterium aquidurense]|uniref:sugar phosphate isomerase/epimerase family protein n=1 Tax=Flavobacterium aquidurense TaxID=362413 RepID=UPI00091C2C85|nr:TIM barrel protein [Flavobacterium aquidurense]OXA69850.1 endonuclease [Flavobacterium aquidurense]SHG53439.1 Sugar phosphate isomerase/epimerase [Flavobacterium frigidimaris]
MKSFLKKQLFIAFLVALSTAFNSCATAQSSNNKQRYKVAVCDWMILKRQKLGSFALAAEIKADGIELDMGGLGNRPTFDSKLGDPIERQKFLDKSKELNVGISSIAMSGFYAQSFAKRETIVPMIEDCAKAMKDMKVKVAYLPLGTESDLVKNPELRPVIIERLKWAGKQVGKIGGVIAIETSLDATEEKKLLEEIDSKYIKSSFNFANAVDNGRDIVSELKILGKKHLAQIHASNTDKVWLENDTAIDMPKIKTTLDEMKWSGWLIVERSRDVTQVHNVKANYGANVAYLKRIFQN